MTETPPELPLNDPARAVRITTDGFASSVMVGDTDLGDALRGYTLEHQAGQPPVLVLYRSITTDPVLFEGMARVLVGEPPEPADSPGDAIAAFLGSIDPAALENAALNRDDLGHDRYELTRAMLRQLADWAQGKG
ncbi:hypothetical protein ABZ404_39160 [Streptomyces sp. NPDC005878]|uniref:hypothetical protein n=1 Tax=Streptomyces sp. NPDC005878 TaxID=3157077 RepID=UPI0033FBE32B